MALATAALLLAGLYAVARTTRRWRTPNSAQRTIVIVETVGLSPHAALHAVKAGERYLLIGSTPNAICTLADLSNLQNCPEG
jgi:flagellar biogenesis protein FliO